jgi:diaminopimelate decarboxylase
MIAAGWPDGLPLSVWGLERDRDGVLMQNGCSLDEIASRFGSPVHVVDVPRLEQHAKRFTVFPVTASAPCDVYYSYKTNPVPGVLQLLHSLGIGAEVTSPYELWLARRLNVPASSIIYNEPAKTEASMREALAHDVGLINLNAWQEIAPLAALARRLKRKPRVGIRVAVPEGISGQFGERIDTGAALRAFTMAIQYLELDVVALHAHLNGELATYGQLASFVDHLLAFVDQLHAKLGLQIEVLDLGGNLHCPTIAHRSPLATRLALATGVDVPLQPKPLALTVDTYVRAVAQRVDAHFKGSGRRRPRVVLEPGRAVTASTQLLLCRVLQVREPDASGISTAVLDAGLNIIEAARHERHQIFPVRQRPGTERRRYRLMGPTCTLGDLVSPGVELDTLEVGDTLAVMDVGAYCVPYSTCFSFPRPAVVAVRNGIAGVLRRHESFEDLVALDQLSEDAPAQREKTREAAAAKAAP